MECAKSRPREPDPAPSFHTSASRVHLLVQLSAPKAQKLVEILGELARTKPLSPFAFLRQLPQAEPSAVLPTPAQQGQVPPSEVA